MIFAFDPGFPVVENKSAAPWLPLDSFFKMCLDVFSHPSLATSLLTILGMDVEKFEHSWGGEDWEFLDRTLAAEMEAERIKYPGLYHHYHDRDAWRKKPQHSFEDNR